MANLRNTIPNIFKVIEEIKQSENPKVFLRNFDKLLCIFMAPVLFLSSAAILLYDYFETGAFTWGTYMNFGVMLTLSFSFIILLQIELRAILRHHLISLLYSMVLLFSVVRFYYIVGPALWTFAFIQIVLSLSQNSKSMLFYTTISLLLAIGHATFNPNDMIFIPNIYYTIVQFILFTVLYFVAKVIFEINNNHINKVESQLVSLESEISQRIKAEEKSRYLALYDQLTGLPNRTLFSDRLEQGIALAARNNLDLYVLFIDIDVFKLINDTLGHHSGDELLKKVGERMSENLRESDAICRVSGDEFLIMLLDINNRDYIDSVAIRILKRINTPFEVEGNTINISCSIGISKYPDDASNAEKLIKRADIAMYKAKQNGKNRYEKYSRQLEASRFEEMEIVNSLQNALINNEFSLHYQPQVDGKSNSISGFEALIRWKHPTRGFMSPTEFIPIAEKSGIIIPIGEWVIRTACIQNKKWQQRGMEPKPVAVNISINQINNYDLYLLIKEVLEETGLEPKYLEIEITETILAKEAKMLSHNLEKIRELGVKITIDDFGTGYSAIQYLKSFPIDRIKIPMNFVHGINKNEKDESIISVIMALADSMKLDVVAEGVETRQQLDFLTERFCNTIQGYYFCKPMSAEQVEEYVRMSEVAIS